MCNRKSWLGHYLDTVVLRKTLLATIMLLQMTVNSQQLIPGGSVVKNLPANVGDTGDASLIPGLGRSPGEGNVNLL